MNNEKKGGESLYGNCHIYKDHQSSPAVSSLIGWGERGGRDKTNCFSFSPHPTHFLSLSLSCCSPTFAFRKINSDESDKVQPHWKFTSLPVQPCSFIFQSSPYESHSSKKKKGSERQSRGGQRRVKINFLALWLAKVEKKNNCLQRRVQVDICENLILMCQTLYFSKEIDASTQPAAGGL